VTVTEFNKDYVKYNLIPSGAKAFTGRHLFPDVEIGQFWRMTCDGVVVVKCARVLPAKATHGFHQVIVKDCPYCHGVHTHSAGAEGVRTAECLQGEYILDFTPVSFDLMREADVVALMSSSRSKEEWNSNYENVLSANNGRVPIFWYRAVELERIYQKVSKNFKAGVTFDGWCESKQIRGNWKEAFYHHLMAKYSKYDNPASVIDQLTQEAYAEEWNVVLKNIMAKVNGVM